MGKCIWEKYTEQELKDFVANSRSYMELAKQLGYSLGGSYVNSMRKMIAHYNFDVSHFIDPTQSNANNFDYSRFTTNSLYAAKQLRPALLHLRGNQCEQCKLTEWLEQPIVLEVHHLDGDKTNNTLENLQLLCPNCHSLTDNWRGRKKEQQIDSPSIQTVESKQLYCKECGTPIGGRSKHTLCHTCASVAQRTVERPTPQQLAQEILNTSFCAVGRKYGVSDNAIRKWCKTYGIPTNKEELKQWLLTQ